MGARMTSVAELGVNPVPDRRLTAWQRCNVLREIAIGDCQTLMLSKVLGPGVHEKRFHVPVRLLDVSKDAPAERAVRRLTCPYGRIVRKNCSTFAGGTVYSTAPAPGPGPGLPSHRHARLGDANERRASRPESVPAREPIGSLSVAHLSAVGVRMSPGLIAVLRVRRRVDARCSSPVLTSEIELSTLGCGLPSGVGQSRQEAQDLDIHALPGRLKQMEQIRVQREAETMRDRSRAT